MRDSHDDTWSLLGSRLWLRPVRPSDLQRLEAFLARRGQNRSRGADARAISRLLPWDRDPRDRGHTGPTLIATDPYGAPAGFFAVHTGLGDGPPELSFVVPGDAPEVLREGLRLLADGFAEHAEIEELLLRVEPGAFDAVLRDIGWRESDTEPGVWRFRFRKPVPQETPRAR